MPPYKRSRSSRTSTQPPAALGKQPLPAATHDHPQPEGSTDTADPSPPKQARKAGSKKKATMSMAEMQELLLASTQRLEDRMQATAEELQAQVASIQQRVEEVLPGGEGRDPEVQLAGQVGGEFGALSRAVPSLVSPRYAPSEPAPCVPDDMSIDTNAFAQAMQSMLVPHNSAHTGLSSGGFMLAGSFLSVKVKTLIRQGQYVELGLMEPKSNAGPEARNTRWAAYQTQSASISFAPPKVAKATSKDQWAKWFCT